MADSVLRTGQREPQPAPVELTAGPVRAVLEGGDLRYVRAGGAEILRRVYVAVRDRNWGTVPGAISGLSVERRERSFHVTFVCDHREGEVWFRWNAEITGSEDGSIRYVMDGSALGSFFRNRIGFCVLHPMDLAGSVCAIDHTDGSQTRGTFPAEISPHQPFKDIRSIVQERCRAAFTRVDFEGDVFEMEDQRNWTDASFKTYCTPLEAPFPVLVEEGTRIRQSVSVRLIGQPAASGRRRAAARPASVRLEPGVVIRDHLPPFGVCINQPQRPLTARETKLLGAVRPAHLRLDLIPASDGARAQAARAAAEAARLHTELVVALHLSEPCEEELRAVRSWADEDGWRPAWWLVFSRMAKATPEHDLQAARTILGPGTCAAGTDAFFAELNRIRPVHPGADAVVFSVNPQVHAFDNASLTETLEAQEAAVRSARAFVGGLPVLVSPVSFRMRWNPNATGPAAAPPAGTPPEQVDLHQLSLYGAGWTMASVKHLAAGGAAAITYYETAGWLGIMQGDDEPSLREAFPARRGEVFPLYHALADLGEIAGAQIADLWSSDPLAAQGLVARRGPGRRVILAANFTDRRLEVTAAGFEGRWRLRSLDEGSQAGARAAPETFRSTEGEEIRMRRRGTPLRLEPCAYVRIDEVEA